MKILIIRHGDPDYSIDSLTATGFREAALLAKRLMGMNIKSIYISPLGRAQATAKPLLEGSENVAVTLDWLREFPPLINGKEGKERPSICWDWLPSQWTAEPDFFDKDKWMRVKVMEEAGVPESYAAVCGALDALLSEHGYIRDGLLYRAERANEDTIALFCHFGLECVLLSHLLNISPMPLWHGTCALPSSVTTLVTEERREGTAYFRMLSFGDTSHLYAESVEPSFAARFRETAYREDQRKD